MLFDSDSEGRIPLLLGLFLTYCADGGKADATPPRLQATEPPVHRVRVCLSVHALHHRSHFTTSKES